MKTVAIVPARSSSRRFPRKNFTLFEGEPLVVRVLKMLKGSGHFDQVVVSLDDVRDAEIVAPTGVAIHLRRSETTRYETNVASVCSEVLNFLEWNPETFCCVYATAFLLQAETLMDAYERMVETDAAGAMGVSRIRDGARAMLQKDSGHVKPLLPASISLQGQELPAVVKSNGTFYWVKSSAFRQVGNFYVDPLVGYVVPEDQVSDIDYPSDMIKIKTTWQSGNRSMFKGENEQEG
jgi:CMP-N-acetylneuraminic acid synthetase